MRTRQCPTWERRDLQRRPRVKKEPMDSNARYLATGLRPEWTTREMVKKFGMPAPMHTKKIKERERSESVSRALSKLVNQDQASWG